jgi:ParB family chromosome partitioning protein
MTMFTVQIVPMSERKYRLIPLDQIRVLNSRNRDQKQFDENKRSIGTIGLLKPIVVNERNHKKDGFYELVCGEGRYLAHKNLGKDRIPAEVINCDKKTALLYSLVENIARVPPNTMWYAREMKRMKDAGLSIQQICKITGKDDSYVGNYINLVEMGEERLIKGVEQGLFSMSFAAIVARGSSEEIQNVLMDAFDSGMISSSNASRVKSLIELRFNRGKQAMKKKTPDSTKAADSEKADYSLKDLKRDITKATEEKEKFVREASARENRVLALLDGLQSLWQNPLVLGILKEESLLEKPELIGHYGFEVKTMEA